MRKDHAPIKQLGCGARGRERSLIRMAGRSARSRSTIASRCVSCSTGPMRLIQRGDPVTAERPVQKRPFPRLHSQKIPSRPKRSFSGLKTGLGTTVSLSHPLSGGTRHRYAYWLRSSINPGSGVRTERLYNIQSTCGAARRGPHDESRLPPDALSCPHHWRWSCSHPYRLRS